MSTVNVYEAKARLSALISEAEAGGDVVIAKAGRPAVRLVPVASPAAPRQPGLLRSKIVIGDDFDTADAQIERMFNGDAE